MEQLAEFIAKSLYDEGLKTTPFLIRGILESFERQSGCKVTIVKEPKSSDNPDYIGDEGDNKIDFGQEPKLQR